MRGTSAPRPRGVGVGRPGGGRHCETQAPGELQGSYCTNGVYSCIVYSHFSIAYCVLQPRPLLHAIPPVPIRPIEPRLVQPHVPCASPHTRRRSRSHCLWKHFAPVSYHRSLELCGAHSPCPFRITAPPSTAAIIYTCRRYGHRCCRTSPITSGCSAWGLWLEGRIVGVHIRQRCNFLRGHGPNRTGRWSSHLSLYKERRAELNEGRGNQTQRAEG